MKSKEKEEWGWLPQQKNKKTMGEIPDIILPFVSKRLSKWKLATVQTNLVHYEKKTDLEQDRTGGGVKKNMAEMNENYLTICLTI